MGDDFSIRGADQFHALSKALKAAGETELRKKLHKGLRDGAKPLIPLTREAARSELPQKGGLAKQVAKAPQRIAVRTGRDPGVRLVVSKRSGVRASNRGLLRHPAFPKKGTTRDQWTWVEQRVKGGWFDDTASHSAHVVIPALEGVLDEMADEIVRRARRG